MSEKARYWEGILYPENMVEDWKECISELLEFPYVYCVHDKDLLKDSEESRKEHIHCIIAYNAPTTEKQVKKLFNRLSKSGRICCPRVQDKYNIRSAYNYLIHDTEDSRKKGKFQYDKTDRIEGNGFDIGVYEVLSLADKEKMVDELCEYIVINQVTNYIDFYIGIREKYDVEYSRLIRSYSGHFDRMIKGMYHKKGEKNGSLIDEIERKEAIIKAQKEYIERLEEKTK